LTAKPSLHPPLQPRHHYAGGSLDQTAPRECPTSRRAVLSCSPPHPRHQGWCRLAGVAAICPQLRGRPCDVLAAVWAVDAPAGGCGCPRGWAGRPAPPSRPSQAHSGVGVEAPPRRSRALAAGATSTMVSTPFGTILWISATTLPPLITWSAPAAPASCAFRTAHRRDNHRVRPPGELDCGIAQCARRPPARYGRRGYPAQAGAPRLSPGSGVAAVTCFDHLGILSGGRGPSPLRMDRRMAVGRLIGTGDPGSR
jgi:hypothetical protein